MASIAKRPDGRWRARYRDADKKEHSKHFRRKVDAEAWLADVKVSIRTGRYVDPRRAKITMQEWTETWLEGYSQNQLSTVRQAKVHIGHINKQFGARQLSTIRPSEVKTWTAAMKKAGMADSTVYAIYRRLAQLFSDAVEDGYVVKSPVSRKTAPPVARSRPYVATTEQVWALHDVMPEGVKPAILLGAFAGLRISEAVALTVDDVDFMRGTITVSGQYKKDTLKTVSSEQSIPISTLVAVELNRMPNKLGTPYIVTSAYGRPMSPHTVENYIRERRGDVEGLPEKFRFHDLRHYYASLLISKGLDVKVVQRCLRHASAKTTLDTYGHMFPNKEESARAAITEVMEARADSLRTKPAESLLLRQQE